MISPTGAPYCYLVPSGLYEIKALQWHGAAFQSAVGLGGRDVIAVGAFRTRANTDDMTDDELLSASDQLVKVVLRPDFTFASTTGDWLRVDGARALHYHGRSKTEAYYVDFYWVYRGQAKLQINCQYQYDQKQMTAGCHQLLHTLQFKSVE